MKRIQGTLIVGLVAAVCCAPTRAKGKRNMTTAIIGVGKIGAAIAEHLVKGGGSVG
jgi:lactate dehydrogenase-like 2-hydroxyacid dehydrogenase